MRNAKRGAKAIKDATETYLPKPSGFISLPDSGAAMYAAYQARAQFPSLVAQTIAGMAGVIHRTEAKIEMPAQMEPLWERATPDGLPLEAFHRRITTELLLTGRYGVLVDMVEGEALPIFAGYVAETIINWDDTGDFFVLDETAPVRDGFEWTERPKWRALDLEDGRYRVRVFSSDTSEAEPIEPTAMGGKRLDEVPFVAIGARDLTPDPEDPPLLGVANASVSIYQLSADYRWQLFMTGQETLFIINGVGDDAVPQVVGAGVILALNGGDGQTPDAKYVGPAGTGIEAHRKAIEDERQAAAAAGAKLFETGGASDESGEAKRIRFTAETATLTTIAQTSAQGLERALRYAAKMMGLDPEKITVTPNLDFIDSQLTPADAQALVSVWQEGAISYETLYGNLQAGGIASAERDHEEELKLIDDEDIGTGEPPPEEAGLIMAGATAGDAGAQMEVAADGAA